MSRKDCYNQFIKSVKDIFRNQLIRVRINIRVMRILQIVVIRKLRLLENIEKRNVEEI